MVNRKREGKEGLRAKGKGQNRKALIGKVSRAPPPPVSPAPHCAPFFFPTLPDTLIPFLTQLSCGQCPFSPGWSFQKGNKDRHRQNSQTCLQGTDVLRTVWLEELKSHQVCHQSSPAGERRAQGTRSSPNSTTTTTSDSVSSTPAPPARPPSHHQHHPSAYVSTTIINTHNKRTHIRQCSSQHCLQQLGHGSNPDVHRHMNG